MFQWGYICFSFFIDTHKWPKLNFFKLLMMDSLKSFFRCIQERLKNLRAEALRQIELLTTSNFSRTNFIRKRMSAFSSLERRHIFLSEFRWYFRDARELRKNILFVRFHVSIWFRETCVTFQILYGNNLLKQKP